MDDHDAEGAEHVASDSMWRQFYRLGASTPHSWALTAMQLGRAAELVLDAVHSAQAARPGLMSASLDPNADVAVREEAEDMLMEAQHDASLFNVALMLAGFGIENLAKATLIRGDDAAVQDDSLVGHLKTHDLNTLVRRCGITPTAEQDYVLRILSRQVKCSGRYPFPLNWCELQKRQKEMLEADVSPMTTSQIEVHVVEVWTVLWEGLNGTASGEVES